MKRIVFYGILGLLVLGTALVYSCKPEENIEAMSNDGSVGELSYAWSQSQLGDTAIVVCQQTVVYKEKGQTKVIYPKAMVKVWPKTPVIDYTKGNDPTPIFIKTSSVNGYKGTNPRQRVINQEITLLDGQIINAQITSDLYSYKSSSGREMFFPHIELQELMFGSASYRYASGTSGTAYPEMTFNFYWNATNGGESGTEKISVSYTKNEVTQADKLLTQFFDKGIEWTGDNTFVLYVEQTQRWQIAGEKKVKKTSPVLDFSLIGKENKNITASKFDFVGTLKADDTLPKDTISNGWNIKKATATKTVMFSNGAEYFEDTFTYPKYEASFVFEGTTFEFDLSVEFTENHRITKQSEDKANNMTTGVVTFGDRSFTSTVLTSMTKDEATPSEPDVTGSKHGKILGYSVTAVFDPAALNGGKTASITKKCVLVHYERGYDWGICEYNQDFPTNFTYTSSTYKGFDSAAKHSVTEEFQLARTVQSNSSMLWYNSSNKLIAGLDALTCKIYGWENVVDGIYASQIKTYKANYKNDNYQLTLTAPDGTTKVFQSSPY